MFIALCNTCEWFSRWCVMLTELIPGSIVQPFHSNETAWFGDWPAYICVYTLWFSQLYGNEHNFSFAQVYSLMGSGRTCSVASSCGLRPIELLFNVTDGHRTPIPALSTCWTFRGVKLFKSNGPKIQRVPQIWVRSFWLFLRWVDHRCCNGLVVYYNV